MLKSINGDFMKIHFTWINWCLENRKKVRKRISGATEEERIEIAKHEGLDNAFLIRRLKDVAFQNLIYYKILSDRDIYRKIMPKLTEILSKNVMYSEDIIELLKKDGLKANVIYPFDTPIESSLKMEGTNISAINYIRLLLRHYIEVDDIENIINVQAYLKEYESSIFQVNDLYKSSFIYSGKSYPVIYGNILKSYLTENLKNSLLHESSDTTNRMLFTQLSSLFAFPLKTKLRTLVYQILDVSQDKATITQYPLLFNHLLSVASMLYFTNLSLKEKLELLNCSFELDQLIFKLEEYNFEWDFIHWKFVSSHLIDSGFFDLALTLNEIILKNHLSKVLDTEKYFLYDGLGTIHRNLGNYEKAREFFQKAIKWIDTANTKGFVSSNEEIDEKIFGKSKEYYRIVCLKNIGENYGHSGLQEIFNKTFEAVEKRIIELDSNYEKFYLFVNLSVASNRLNNFSEERNYLNRALDFFDDGISYQEIENIQKKIEEFDETKMSYEKLTNIKIDIEIRNFIKSGDFLQKSFSFHHSLGFYQKALQISEKFTNDNYKSILYLKLAMSYFYLREWENSKHFLEKLLLFQEEFEIKLIYFIVLYLSGEIEKSKNLLVDIPDLLKKHPEQKTLINTWFINIINSMGKEKFLEISSYFKELEEPVHAYYLFIFGNALADNGFSKLAIKFFKRELKYIKDEKKKAAVYNDIGGIYSDLDDYDTAINYFKLAVELDDEYDRCFSNLAEIYSRKLDNVNAKESLEKAIIIARKKGKSEIQSYEEKLAQINRLLENVLNINSITKQEIINILITVEQKLIDYHHKDSNFDASDIILGYSKALEIMLDDKVSIKFKPLIIEYRRTRRKTSEDFKKKFGWLFKDKTISLGTWVRIFEDFQKESIDDDVKKYRDQLKSIFSLADLEELKRICKMIVNERNKIAHTAVLNIDQVVSIRKKFVPQFNLITKILYK